MGMYKIIVLSGPPQKMADYWKVDINKEGQGQISLCQVRWH